MCAAILTAPTVFATLYYVCYPTDFSSAALTRSGHQRRLLSAQSSASAAKDVVRLVCGVRGSFSGAHKPPFRGESGQPVTETEDELVSCSLLVFDRPFPSPSAEVTRSARTGCTGCTYEQQCAQKEKPIFTKTAYNMRMCSVEATLMRGLCLGSQCCAQRVFPCKNCTGLSLIRGGRKHWHTHVRTLAIPPAVITLYMP